MAGHCARTCARNSPRSAILLLLTHSVVSAGSGGKRSDALVSSLLSSTSDVSEPLNASKCSTDLHDAPIARQTIDLCLMPGERVLWRVLFDCFKRQATRHSWRMRRTSNSSN